MSIKMIDIQCAQTAMQRIIIGQEANLQLDGASRTFEVVEKTLYMVTVKRGSSTLCCPIEFFDVYREELANMARIPATGMTARGSGRPRKATDQATGPVAALEHPAPSPPPVAPPSAPPSAPPGAPFQGWQGPAVGQTPEPVIATSSLSPSLQIAMKEIEIASDNASNMQWLVDVFDASLSGLRQEFVTMVKTYEAAQEPDTALETTPTVATCADCMHSNLALDICDLFKIKPPMKVVANARANCDKFEDQIPF